MYCTNVSSIRKSNISKQNNMIESCIVFDVEVSILFPFLRIFYWLQCMTVPTLWYLLFLNNIIVVNFIFHISSIAQTIQKSCLISRYMKHTVQLKVRLFQLLRTYLIFVLELSHIINLIIIVCYNLINNNFSEFRVEY